MAQRPPSKKPPKLDVSPSSFRIDDPTAAFPIGALNDPTSLEDDAVSPISPDPVSAAPKVGRRTPVPAGAARAPSRPITIGGVDLRWLVLSVVAGAVMAAVVVAGLGLLVLLVR